MGPTANVTIHYNKKNPEQNITVQQEEHKRKITETNLNTRLIYAHLEITVLGIYRQTSNVGQCFFLALFDMYSYCNAKMSCTLNVSHTVTLNMKYVILQTYKILIVSIMF